MAADASTPCGAKIIISRDIDTIRFRWGGGGGGGGACLSHNGIPNHRQFVRWLNSLCGPTTMEPSNITLPTLLRGIHRHDINMGDIKNCSCDKDKYSAQDDITETNLFCFFFHAQFINNWLQMSRCFHSFNRSRYQRLQFFSRQGILGPMPEFFFGNDRQAMKEVCI